MSVLPDLNYMYFYYTIKTIKMNCYIRDDSQRGWVFSDYVAKVLHPSSWREDVQHKRSAGLHELHKHDS